MTTSSDPATIRRRRTTRRGIGLGLILAGVVALAVSVFVLVVLETTIAPPDAIVNCGSAVAPTPEGSGLCRSTLGRLWLIGGGFGIAGILALAAGIALRAITPRPLSF